MTDALKNLQALLALNDMITKSMRAAELCASAPYKEIAASILERLAANPDMPEQDSSRLKKVVALFEACDELTQAAAQIAIEELELRINKMAKEK